MLADLRGPTLKRLSVTQVSGYDTNGYVLPALRAVDSVEASALRAELERVEVEEGEPASTALAHGHTRFPWLHRLVTNPAIVDAVEDLIGPNILVWSVSVFVKEPGSGAYIGWHQDSNYWGLTDLDGVVTAWVALQDVGDQAGPMEFIRGSHLREPQPQEDSYNPNNLLSRGQEIKWAEPINPADVASATMLAGEFSLHHIKIAHASGPNEGQDRRIGVAIRYMPTCTRTERDEDVAMLVRGEDKFGHFTLERPPLHENDAAIIEQLKRGRQVKAKATLQGTDASLLANKKRLAAQRNVPAHLRDASRL